MALSESATNHEVLVREGLASPTQRAEKHQMTLTYSFLDPRNGHNHNRPVVDVTAPPNPIDERHSSRFAVMKGFFFTNSLNQVTDAYEAVPYVESNHNSEFVLQSLLYANGLYMNYYLCRCGIAQIQPGHPHTQWAHSIVFSAGIIRTTLATLIAVGGSLYTYEFLYTSVPGFKIRDPSLNGWKRPYEEGQSTYLARAVSMMAYPVAFSFWSRSLKRFHFYTGFALYAGTFYEYYRNTYGTSHRIFYGNCSKARSDVEGRLGSLVPQTSKKMDRDTEKLGDVHNTRYMNLMHSGLKELVYDNLSHDIMPLRAGCSKLSNVYYKWDREVDSRGSRKYRYKAESFELPWFMDKMAIEAN